jgi:hypothetical protein
LDVAFNIYTPLPDTVKAVFKSFQSQFLQYVKKVLFVISEHSVSCGFTRSLTLPPFLQVHLHHNPDEDVDGSDASAFKADFGRSAIEKPCTSDSLKVSGILLSMLA